MLPTHLPAVVSTETLAKLKELVTTAKHNIPDELVGGPLAEDLLDDPIFRMTIHPRRLFGVKIAYVADHLDYDLPPRAVMGRQGENILRADFGVIACLTGACYVALDAGYGPLKLPLAESDVLISPSSASLTISGDGEAWVACFWGESLVRSASVREILHDIGTALEFAEILGSSDIEGIQDLRACYHTILGMYVET
jgi:hypothetical protein